MQAIDSNAVVYPDSDGAPMADNTLQFEWIVVLKENLDAALPGFVAGDLLWYPIEGDNRTRRAPDVLVALDRPKGHRGSYKQWVEGGPPDVVMEVLSPRNTPVEMFHKLAFYSEHGAKEFYVLDPMENELLVWVDRGHGLAPVKRGESFESPLLGITFRVNHTVRVFHRDGSPFRSFQEILAERDAALERAAKAEARAAEAEARAEALHAELRALRVDPSVEE